MDFAPEYTLDEIQKFIENFLNFEDSISQGAGMETSRLKACLAGILNSKLAEVLAELAQCDNSEKVIKRAAHLIKGFKINVSGTKGWDDAQVTCGGVSRQEIDAETMESKLKKNLFLCGEVLDVDGKCGGYNLQWAWASGHVAGRTAAGQNITGRTAAGQNIAESE